LLKQLLDQTWPLTPVRQAVNAQRIVERSLYRRARIERRRGILKHHLEACAGCSQFSRRQCQQVTVVQRDATGIRA
jgi:hypothetical protein